ncbi:MAG: hypothetical protein QXX34_00500 [Candidatus Bathyarchaeia archaeon]
MSIFYSSDRAVLQRANEGIRKAEQRLVSTIVIRESYQRILKKEGRKTAVLRTNVLEKDFRIVNVNAELAKNSAEL